MVRSILVIPKYNITCNYIIKPRFTILDNQGCLSYTNSDRGYIRRENKCIRFTKKAENKCIGKYSVHLETQFWGTLLPPVSPC